MAFQSAVNTLQGFGIPGERYLDSPHRVESLAINSNALTPNTYAYWATKPAAGGAAQMGGVVSPGTATFTGAIATTVLTVSAITAGAIQIGQTVAGSGVTTNTTITAYGTGTGGVGTYTVSTSQTVASEALTTSGGINRVLAGLMVTPKEATLWGTTSGTLAPTLVIPDNAQAEFATMGDYVVTIPNACNIGDLFAYNVTTGALATYAPSGTPPAGCAAIPNAIIYRYAITASGGGVTVMRLTN